MTRALAAPAVALPVQASARHLADAPEAPDPAVLRVVMVVANDVTRDSRVLREAAALATAGHSVTVLGMMTAKTTAPAIEIVDGFVIRRLSYRARPPGWWIPPNFYARVGARAARQYRVHRARIRASLRGGGAAAQRLSTRAGLLPRRVSAGSRRLAARVGRLPRSLAFRRGTRESMPEPTPWAVPPRRRRARSRAARELRGFLRRARRTPLSQWPDKTARLVGRTSRRIAAAAAASARAAELGLRRGMRALGAPAATAALAGAGVRRAGRRAGERALELGQDASAVGRTAWRGLTAWAAIARLLLWGSAYLAANGASGGALEWLTGWRWRWLGWARYVAQHAPDADVWHGHDLTSLPAVVSLKRQRGGIAVYDSHEIYVESGRHAQQPRWAKRQLEGLERRLVAEVDAVITVNRSLAAILAERLGRQDIEVLYNCPARFDARRRASPLRSALGLPADVPLLLYHGALSPHRGVEQLLAAIRLPGLTGVHLAFLGFGPLREWLGAEAQAPVYGGRVHVVDAVRPDELLEWLVGVDIAVAPIQDSTLNHRYSSPNKVFEAIAVGTPVAGSDFPEFRRVIADPAFGSLGALFEPDRPEAIAAAVRSLLELPPSDRAALRERCRRAASERWNWETEASSLVDLYGAFAVRGAPSHQPAVNAA